MLLAIGALAAAATLLNIESDGAVTRARNTHNSLMIMLHHPLDHSSSLATPMFRKLADDWDSYNMTFALVNSEKAPELAKSLIGETGNVPAYALFLKGMSAPVRYKGGWSAKSIAAWLHKQTAMRPIEARNSRELREAVRENAHGLALVGFLTDAQRDRKLLELAARAAQAPAAVIHGSSKLAKKLLGEEAATKPCILVVRENATRWPLLGGALTQIAVTAFAKERAMPALVTIGDKARDFTEQIRSHPLQLQVLLYHRSGADGPHAPSDEAIETMKLVAERHDGKAVFASYDFFDNDPDAFSTHKMYANDLPSVIAVHERGGFNERTWRMPTGSGGDNGIFEDEVDRLVERALGELDSRSQGKLTAIEQQRTFEVPERFWEKGRRAQARDEL